MNDIKKYWDTFWDNRKDFGSQNDLFFQELSSDVIASLLKPEEVALDVGCGDGCNSGKYARIVKKVIGFDYSESAIKKATVDNRAMIEKGKMSFAIWNLLEKRSSFTEVFDVVICERTLSNLSKLKEQETALGIMRDYLKIGGRAIICEPSLEGYDRLDEIRKSFGLPVLKRHWHNLLVDEKILQCSKFFEIEKRVTFGVYSLISRVFYPLFILPDEPVFDSKVNKIAKDICRSLMMQDEYSNLPSQHILYVLRKR